MCVINGKHLLDEVSKIHNIGPHAEGFYQKTILSSLQMLNFLKPTENLGFYIDSEEPYFRFKIEIGNSGSFRTLLLPEEFQDFPKSVTGKCRIYKTYTSREPYTSIINLENHPLENIANEMMEKSYQTNSKILLKEDSKVSILLTKLPPSNVNKKIEDFEDLNLSQIESTHQEFIEKVFNQTNFEIPVLEELFNELEMNYIGSKQVEFHCPCSRDRMIENLFTLSLKDREEIFHNSSSVDTRCDYCNTIYTIQKDEILKDLH